MAQLVRLGNVRDFKRIFVSRDLDLLSVQIFILPYQPATCPPLTDVFLADDGTRTFQTSIEIFTFPPSPFSTIS